ncbi:MAG: purine-nucleoside phosphorylase, partial [Bacteroidota bacterium]
IVGMSTVPEVLVARHMDLKVCAISVVTDECDPDNLQKVTLEDVIQVANEAEPKLTRIFSDLIQGL